jgi:hypothetical protein
MKWFSKVIYDAYPEGCDFPTYGGSTNDLRRRQKQHRKNHPGWFGKGTLKAVRTVEGWFESENSFDALVAVIEQKHIVLMGYDIGMGENRLLPVDAYLNGFCPTHEMASKGGHVIMERGVGCFAPGIARVGGQNQPHEAKVRGGQNQSREAKVKGGLIGGRISACLQWNIRRGQPCVCGHH